MRKLIFAINSSLDGCCDHTKFFPDEETMAYFTQLTRDTDTFLYGRNTYQLMVPYWPDAAKQKLAGDSTPHFEYARAYDAVDKIVVFSATLDSADDQKTRIVRTGLQDEILKLKQEQGKNMMVGGVNLAGQIAALGLIDEYHIVMHPIIVGEGKRLFEGINLQEKLQLKLAKSTVFKTGAVLLRYLKQ